MKGVKRHKNMKKGIEMKVEGLLKSACLQSSGNKKKEKKNT